MTIEERIERKRKKYGQRLLALLHKAYDLCETAELDMSDTFNGESFLRDHDDLNRAIEELIDEYDIEALAGRGEYK